MDKNKNHHNQNQPTHIHLHISTSFFFARSFVVTFLLFKRHHQQQQQLKIAAPTADASNSGNNYDGSLNPLSLNHIIILHYPIDTAAVRSLLMLLLLLPIKSHATNYTESLPLCYFCCSFFTFLVLTRYILKYNNKHTHVLISTITLDTLEHTRTIFLLLCICIFFVRFCCCCCLQFIDLKSSQLISDLL